MKGAKTAREVLRRRKLPAWAFPDDEGILSSYPSSHALGNVDGARKLHLYDSDGYHRAACGIVLDNYVEHSSKRRPVCSDCRKFLEREEAANAV